MEQAFDTFGIHMAVVELAAQFAVQHKFRRRCQRVQRRNAQVVEKPRERRVTVGEQAVGVVDFVARGGENLIEHLALLVAEKIFDGIMRLAKILVGEPDQFGKIGTLKRAAHCLKDILIFLRAERQPDAAVQIVIAKMNDDVNKSFHCTRNGKRHLDPPDGEPRVAGGEQLPVFLFDDERIDARFFGIRLKQRTYGIMRGHFFPRHHCGFRESFVNHPPIFIFGQVAFRLVQNFQETGLQIFRGEACGQLNRTRGVLNDLHGFDPGNLVKKPAAAREHEHRVPLHFEQTQRGVLFVLGQIAQRVLPKKLAMFSGERSRMTLM